LNKLAQKGKKMVENPLKFRKNDQATRNKSKFEEEDVRRYHAAVTVIHVVNSLRHRRTAVAGANVAQVHHRGPPAQIPFQLGTGVVVRAHRHRAGEASLRLKMKRISEKEKRKNGFKFSSICLICPIIDKIFNYFSWQKFINLVFYILKAQQKNKNERMCINLRAF
jgi:hypothetical protein